MLLRNTHAGEVTLRLTSMEPRKSLTAILGFLDYPDDLSRTESQDYMDCDSLVTSIFRGSRQGCVRSVSIIFRHEEVISWYRKEDGETFARTV